MTFEATGRLVERDAGDGRSLGRTAAWLAKHVEVALGGVGLTLPQYRVLAMLDGSSALSSDLAERLAVSPPTVTAVVDGLVAKGLVERRTVEADRRRVDHILTADGRSLLDAADAAVDDRLYQIVARLGNDKERSRAFGGLALWRKALIASRAVDRAARVAGRPTGRTDGAP